MTKAIFAKAADGSTKTLLYKEPEALPEPPPVTKLLLPVMENTGMGEHFTADGFDPRLPRPGTITSLTRQTRRQIERGKGRPCGRCGVKVSDATTACLDDGRDAHRACSEKRNEMLIAAAEELGAEDSRRRAEALGLTQVGGGERLWTPTGQEAMEQLDLSTGVLLGSLPEGHTEPDLLQVKAS